jgi:hypothetical protein
MGFTSQQLSQLADAGLLSPCKAYLLLCDTMLWGLATQFYAFSCGFLPCFFVGFVPFFFYA